MARPSTPEPVVAPAEAVAHAGEPAPLGAAPAAEAPSHVYPLGSRLNAAGHLEIGGCDAIELAREFDTPAYVYAEDHLRARARAYREAFAARTDRFEVLYASKA